MSLVSCSAVSMQSTHVQEIMVPDQNYDVLMEEPAYCMCLQHDGIIPTYDVSLQPLRVVAKDHADKTACSGVPWANRLDISGPGLTVEVESWLVHVVMKLADGALNLAAFDESRNSLRFAGSQHVLCHSSL